MHQECSKGSIKGSQLEARALGGLRSRLLTPEIISHFAQHLQRELGAQQRAVHGKRDEIEAARRDTLRTAKIVKRIEEDDDVP